MWAVTTRERGTVLAQGKYPNLYKKNPWGLWSEKSSLSVIEMEYSRKEWET